MKSFGFDDAPFTSMDRFRCQYTGQKTRIAILYGDNKKEITVGSEIHWHTKIGYFLCKHDMCCSLTKSLKRFGTVIVDYGVSSLSDEKVIPTQDMIKAWYFGDRLYKNLCNINNMWNLTETDLIMIGEDADFNRWQIQPYPDHRLINEWPGLKSLVDQVYPSAFNWMKEHLAQDLPVEKIKMILESDLKAKKPDDDFFDALSFTKTAKAFSEGPKKKKFKAPIPEKPKTPDISIDTLLNQFDGPKKKRPFRKMILKRKAKDD